MAKKEIVNEHFKKRQIIHINREYVDALLEKNEPITVSTKTNADEPDGFQKTLDKITSNLHDEKAALDSFKKITILIYYPESNQLTMSEMEQLGKWKEQFNKDAQIEWSLAVSDDNTIGFIFIGTTILP